jgi:hypothetical protein
MILAHQKQVEDFGCLPHAYYAVTRNPKFLEYLTEVIPSRLDAIAVRLGYSTINWFNGGGFYEMPLELVQRELEELFVGQHFRVVGCVKSVNIPNLKHAVGIAFSRKPDFGIHIEVSDSREEAILNFSWQEFTESRYSRLFFVASLHTPDSLIAGWKPDAQKIVRDARGKHV